MPKRGENIYKRKDGRWEGRIQVEGTGKKKSIYGHSYREVKQKITEYKKTTFTSTKKAIRLEVILGEWLDQKKITVKTSTYNKYRNLTTTYIIPKLGNMQISEINSVNVNARKHALVKKRCSKNTADSNSCLSMFPGPEANRFYTGNHKRQGQSAVIVSSLRSDLLSYSHRHTETLLWSVQEMIRTMSNPELPVCVCLKVRHYLYAIVNRKSLFWEMSVFFLCLISVYFDILPLVCPR